MTVQLSVVAPVFNEESSLREFCSRAVAVLSSLSQSFEIILVNDGSKDNSLTVIKDLAKEYPQIKYISFSRNFGHQIAVTAGLHKSIGDCTVIIDTDLQDPPELIADLYKKYREGFEVVYARRIARKGETWFKRLTAKYFYRGLNSITSINIPLDTGDFRIIDSKVREVLNNMPESNKFIRGQVAWAGFRQVSVEFIREERKHGQTGYPLRKMIRFAMNGITGFSDFPLRFASILGFIFSIVAFLIIIYALVSKFVLHQVITGWTSVIISSMFIGGIQLITLGILGEYISRINSDVRNRPLYVVDESNI